MGIEINSFTLLKDGALHIAWSQPSEVEEGAFDETKRKCHAEASPELYKCLEGLRKHVLKIAELEKEKLANINIKALSFSYSGENRIMGATITFSKKLLETPGSKIEITTPKKFVEPINDAAEPTNVFSEECSKLVIEFSNHVKEYIKGKKQQPDIFDDEDGDEE